MIMIFNSLRERCIEIGHSFYNNSLRSFGFRAGLSGRRLLKNRGNRFDTSPKFINGVNAPDATRY